MTCSAPHPTSARNAAASLRFCCEISYAIVLPDAAAGVLFCVLLSRQIASALYGVHPSDPVSFSAALLAVGAIAAAASWLPVWRTLRIDPAVILRDE